MMVLLRILVPVVLLSVAAADPAQSQLACVGDCNRDCRVTIDEIMGGICIHLARLSCRHCDALDGNCSGVIAINELIQGVNSALNGCPSSCTPGESLCGPPTVTATATATATPAPTDPLAATIDDLLDGDRRCGQLWVYASTDRLTVHCGYGPGHETDISFSRQASEAAAADAVAGFAANGGETEFRGAPAFLWENVFPHGIFEHTYRHLRAQLGCWLIASESFDDTIYDLAYHPIGLAEDVSGAVSSELIARCQTAE